MPEDSLQPVSVTFLAEPCDASALGDLLAIRAGRPLEIDDLAEVLEAAIELREAEAGRTRVPPQDGLLFRTRAVGGQVLLSPMLAARIALQRFERWPLPERWRKHPAEWTILAAGYCLAHGCEPAALTALADLPTAERLLEVWATHLTCTPAQLSAVVRDLAGTGYPPISEASSPKKASAGPTPPLSWSDLPTPARAAAPTTGSTKSPKPTSTGCAAPSPSEPATPQPPTTPNASAPTIPGSVPANAGNDSGNG